MTTANAGQQDIERQEEQPAQYATLGERMAAVEGQQRLLIEVVQDNGRRIDNNYLALDAKIDRLYRLLTTAFISLGAISLAALIALIVQLIT